MCSGFPRALVMQAIGKIIKRGKSAFLSYSQMAEQGLFPSEHDKLESMAHLATTYIGCQGTELHNSIKRHFELILWCDAVPSCSRVAHRACSCLSLFSQKNSLPHRIRTINWSGQNILGPFGQTRGFLLTRKRFLWSADSLAMPTPLSTCVCSSYIC
jgi:hypothetical protein